MKTGDVKKIFWGFNIDKVAATLFNVDPVKAEKYRALVAQHAPLPRNGLTSKWIGDPKLLTGRLQTLNYAPARIADIVESFSAAAGEHMLLLAQDHL